jgi:NADH-quinone oxidoreductase subunit N
MRAWEPMLAVVAVATMTVGNLAAINQTNIKRLLAYSSISHAGYMLLGLVAGNETGINGIAVYVMVYTFMNLGAFLVLVALRRRRHHRRGDGRYRRPDAQEPGLRRADADLPALAGRHSAHRRLPGQVLHLPVADRDSPLHAGGHRHALCGGGDLLLLPIVRSMFTREETEKAPLATSFGLRVALAVSGVLTLAIGIYPEPFLRLAQTSLLR